MLRSFALVAVAALLVLATPSSFAEQRHYQVRVEYHGGIGSSPFLSPTLTDHCRTDENGRTTCIWTGFMEIHWVFGSREARVNVTPTFYGAAFSSDENDMSAYGVIGVLEYWPCFYGGQELICHEGRFHAGEVVFW